MVSPAEYREGGVGIQRVGAILYRIGNNFGVDVSSSDIHLAEVNIPDLLFTLQVQDELIRQVDSVLDAAHTHRGLPKSHYDDRMKLAMQWNKFPNLKDHPVSSLSRRLWSHSADTSPMSNRPRSLTRIVSTFSCCVTLSWPHERTW